MKTELLIAGVAIVGLYLWYQNQNGGANNAQRIRYIRTYQDDGVTPQDVGQLGAQINQAGVSVASNVANAGLYALQNWALNGLESLNQNSSGVHGPTDTNLTTPSDYGYSTSSS